MFFETGQIYTTSVIEKNLWKVLSISISSNCDDLETAPIPASHLINIIYFIPNTKPSPNSTPITKPDLPTHRQPMNVPIIILSSTWANL